MLRILSFALLFTSLTTFQLTLAADEPITLIGTIVKWQYPGSEIGLSELSDAETMNADGHRTLPSSLLKTTLTTKDSVEDVLAFYRKLLSREPGVEHAIGWDAAEGFSILFSDDSAGGSFSFHTILVNSDNSSTTILITRGKDDDSTRITWKQYLKHPVRE